ncbi:MAG: biofilm development regulator YmgB/AriR family protein [Dolichospermum sp.]|nr:biofilm development regulator YmgB/AriR family protein [Dolichospermum sp.]
MAGKTISAHIDTETANRVTNLATMEQRRTSQIAGMALKFFVGLPPEARAALWQIEALASPADFEEITREITRTLLHAQYKVANRQIISHLNVDNLEQIETEDDILEAAVALTR